MRTIGSVLSLLALGVATTAQAGTEALARGQALFDNRCGICHAPGGIGTGMLSRRVGPAAAVLAERHHVPQPLVQSVVRFGIGGMPWFTRVELSDAELDLIAAYLARPAAQTASASEEKR